MAKGPLSKSALIQTIADKSDGKLTRKEKAARQGRNPKTGEALTISARSVVSFTPSKALKEAAGNTR